MSQNNFLSPLNYSFVLDRTPKTNYSIQHVSIPGINLGSANIPTPFVRVVNPGNITYTDLAITFKLGDDLADYLEIYDWMIALGHPDNLDPQYKNIRSDARVVIFNGTKNPVMDVSFTDMFPSSLSAINFDSTLTDIQYITRTATFTFNRMYYNKIG